MEAMRNAAAMKVSKASLPATAELAKAEPPLQQASQLATAEPPLLKATR